MRRPGSWSACCSRRKKGGRTGRVIEIVVLQALAHQAQGDMPAALASLERAVTLAEPEGYVRIFADEGPPLVPLLRAVAKQGTRQNYARRLLAAVGRTETGSPTTPALIDPLSERELDVLRLLGTELDGPAIARELTVSLNTMRTHTKNIYAKLAVTNRRAAVRRAAELDLLPRNRSRRLLTVVPGRRTAVRRGGRPAAARVARGTSPVQRTPPRHPPPAESPHQSPGVVMPAHHIRS